MFIYISFGGSMAGKSVKAGNLLARKDTPVDTLWYISEGKVLAKNGNITINLKKGDFIGISDFLSGINSFDYYAAEDATIVSFCSRDQLMQSNFFSSKPENSRAIALSMNHYVRDAYIYMNTLCTRSEKIATYTRDVYDNYLKICRELHTDIELLESMDDLDDAIFLSYSHKCIYQYHKGTLMQLSNKDTATTLIENLVVPGYMIHAVGDLQEVLRSIEYVSMVIDGYNEALVNANKDDLLNRFCSLYKTIGDGHSMSETIMNTMIGICEQAIEVPKDIREKRVEELKKLSESFSTASDDTDKSVVSKLTNSLDQIIEYAKFTGTKKTILKKCIDEYKNLADQNSTEDDARRIRKEIEQHFYELYLAVLEVYLEDMEHPTIVKMFLNFGYLDEELAGIDNAVELYDLAQTYKGRPDQGIFTGLEWLIAIFTREREPSINEFDQNYEAFIKEQAGNGRIPQDKLKLYLKDRGQMVMFELSNMFKSASRMCSGRIMNFCPIFCENQILRSAKEDLIDATDVLKAAKEIIDIDYTLFYRDSLHVYNKKENIHDIVHVEIRPDIILMPVVGSRGAMWQEISGRDRMTPARMMLPVFSVESINKALLRMFAEYRWEMCKRTQGARWNDVTDPSLTSLYYDYLQFYRKNSSISVEQKEKIKLGLQRARNVYKEFFINDYIEYIKYESQGSPHLIKASRNILYMECPFSIDIRNKIASNPLYSELDHRLKIKYAQQLHKLENLEKKLSKLSADPHKEIEWERMYYRI